MLLSLIVAPARRRGRRRCNPTVHLQSATVLASDHDIREPPYTTATITTIVEICQHSKEQRRGFEILFAEMAEESPGRPNG